MAYRVFFAAGPGDIIQAHKEWRQGSPASTEVSLTFSPQYEEFCQQIGAEAYLVGYHRRKEILRDGPFTLEHRPKPMPGASGVRYHLAEILYGLGLCASAFRFRAHVAVIESGSTHYFVMTLFRLLGIKVVLMMHNSLWPSGFPPTSRSRKLILRLDSWFFRTIPTATVAISPECTRQVQQITRGRATAQYQMRTQYEPGFFARIPPHPPHDRRPFHIMFIGRIVQPKGVFDILEMAKKIEERAPGQVRWELCGTGPDLEALKARRVELALEDVVRIRGWTSLEDLVEVYGRSHAAIVPTRSSFCEAWAATVAEAILAGRPAITNSVVPALEVLRPACVEALPDDVDSYVNAILELIRDPDHYDRLCQACPDLRGPFYDREQGVTAVLFRVMPGWRSAANSPVGNDVSHRAVSG